MLAVRLTDSLGLDSFRLWPITFGVVAVVFGGPPGIYPMDRTLQSGLEKRTRVGAWSSRVYRLERGYLSAWTDVSRVAAKEEPSRTECLFEGNQVAKLTDQGKRLIAALLSGWPSSFVHNLFRDGTKAFRHVTTRRQNRGIVVRLVSNPGIFATQRVFGTRDSSVLSVLTVLSTNNLGVHGVVVETLHAAYTILL